jgi:hypothetical protein
MARSNILLLCLLSPGASAGKLPAAAVAEFAEYCVSSRWGFTCFAPSGAATAAAGREVLKMMMARSLVGVAGVVVAREILRDVRELPRYAREGMLADVTLPGAVVVRASSERAASAAAPADLHTKDGAEQVEGAVKGLDALWIEAVATRCDFI